MTEPRTLQLARVTDAQAQALTAIARYGTNRLFTPKFNASADIIHDGMYEGPWRFGMRPVCSDEVAGDMSRCLGLDWHGAAFSLRLSERFCDRWLAARLPDLQLDALPARFIDAAWEAMAGEALRGLGLEQLCAGMGIMPGGAVTAPAPATTMAGGVPRPRSEWQYTWIVSIRPVYAAHTIDAELATDETGLLRLADLLRRLPSADYELSDVSISKLSVGVQAKVGVSTLDVAELHTLQAGDVVLFDRCLATVDGEIYLTTPDGQGMRVRACENGGSRYLVTQEWNLLMNDLSRESLDEADDSEFGSGNGTKFDQTFEARHDDGFAAQFGGEHDAQVGAERGAQHDREHDTQFGGEYDAQFDGAHAARFGGEHDARFAEQFDAPLASDSNEGVGPASVRSGAGASSHDAAPDNGLNVDRIPVRLSFDLGEQMLTLGDLRRLQPGEYFDLQRRLDAGPLHIRANGSLIGTAELVDIEGRIGARVLTLTLDRGSCR